MAQFIALDAPLMLVMGDEEITTTWGDFLVDNDEALTSGMIAQLEGDLLRRPGCTAFLGGGAEAEVSLRLL